MTANELKINLTDSMIDEIERYQKLKQKQTIKDAVMELIKYALTFPQYFKNFNWKNAEKEADEEIVSGKTKSFDSLDDFISDLKK